MKKLIIAIAFCSVISATFSACTEEVITPKQEDTGGDGGGSTSDGEKP